MGESETKIINWNDMSQLGLIRRINTEILHPLGLAISRNLDGTSSQILVASDGVFEYGDTHPVVTDDEVRQKLQVLLGGKNEVQ